jgi:hypothetical protein
VEQSPDTQPSEDDVKAARANVLTQAPAPRFPSEARLENAGGGKITYLGMDVSGDVVAGQPVTITHYFRVDEAAPEGWKLFVHLDSPDKRAHMTADHVPIDGKYPVHRWRAGEIIRDAHKIIVPPSWPGDKLLVYVGLWKGQARFTVKSGRQDGQNRVLAAELPVRGGAAPAPPRRLIVRKLKAGAEMKIDGKLDEAAWQEAFSTGPFVNTLDGSAAQKPASARALWDDKNLYVAFEFTDSDLFSAFDKHDDKLWTQDAAEVFLDADGDGRTYVELQVSPRNVTFDSWLPSYRQNDNAWDSQIVTAVQANGTVNKSDDADTGWTVEMQIPLSTALGRLQAMRGVPPTVGTEWRANFFRMDHTSGKPQGASGWSPPLVGDFHALDKFGVLVFADENGQAKPAAPAPAAAPTAAPAHPELVAPTGTLPPVLNKAALANPHAADGAPANPPAKPAEPAKNPPKPAAQPKK